MIKDSPLPPDRQEGRDQWCLKATLSGWLRWRILSGYRAGNFQSLAPTFPAASFAEIIAGSLTSL